MAAAAQAVTPERARWVRELDGMEICREAAEVFGENYWQPPWN